MYNLLMRFFLGAGTGVNVKIKLQTVNYAQIIP